MALFWRSREKLKKKDAAFQKKIAEANRRISELDFQIADFRRKYQNLQMRGPRAQSVEELEWSLRQMRRQAQDVQALVRECEIDHADCVQIVEDMIAEFETTIATLPDQQ